MTPKHRKIRALVTQVTLGYFWQLLAIAAVIAFAWF
jgi:hypothetical protein